MNASIANQPPTPLSAGQLQPVSPLLLSHPITADRALSVSAQLVAPVACVSDLLPEARSLTAARRHPWPSSNTHTCASLSLHTVCSVIFGIRCVSQKSFFVFTCVATYSTGVCECVYVCLTALVTCGGPVSNEFVWKQRLICCWIDELNSAVLLTRPWMAMPQARAHIHHVTHRHHAVWGRLYEVWKDILSF